MRESKTSAKERYHRHKVAHAPKFCFQMISTLHKLTSRGKGTRVFLKVVSIGLTINTSQTKYMIGIRQRGGSRAIDMLVGSEVVIISDRHEIME